MKKEPPSEKNYIIKSKINDGIIEGDVRNSLPGKNISPKVIKTVVFTIYNHKKDIVTVDYHNKTIKTQEKWNSLNLMHVQSLLGTNHCLPLSHMAKSYIWLEEKNDCINEFSIVYMMNPKFIINKAFKEQVTKYMKTTFGAMTQQHITKIPLKITQEC